MSTAKRKPATQTSRTKTTRVRPATTTPRRAAAPVLVTGASGFLGRHLVAELLSRNVPVRALVRRPSAFLERSGVELVLGDVCDEAACDRAVAGVAEVYHLAGFVSRRDADAAEMYRVHVDGTRTLLRAAAAAGVRRAVVASTSGTIAVSRDPDEVSDETAPYRQSVVSRWPYYLSKIYQEQTALEAGASGLEVVLVLPSLLLGPGDVRDSSTGDVEKVVRGWLPLIPKGGGVAFVDARDAAIGCIQAMEKGGAGERYLLSAANMTLETYLGRVARLAAVPTPRPLIAPRAMRAVARLVEAVASRLDAESPLDVQSVEMAEHTWYVDAAKARRELGWEPRDPAVTLADTVRDVRRRKGLAGGTDDDSIGEARSEQHG